MVYSNYRSHTILKVKMRSSKYLYHLKKKAQRDVIGFHICEISCKPEWFYDKKVSIGRRFFKSRRKTNMKGGSLPQVAVVNYW